MYIPLYVLKGISFKIVLQAILQNLLLLQTDQGLSFNSI